MSDLVMLFRQAGRVVKGVKALSPISLNSNIASLSAQRRLSEASGRLQSSFERLSSGLRINRASDDAAGLALAAGLDVDARVQQQGARNINDSISLVNIAESALSELSNIVIRQQELAEQAGNGAITKTERVAIHDEAEALTNEYNRIVGSTEFNNIDLLDPNIGILRAQAGYGEQGGILYQLNTALSRTAGDGTFGSVLSSATANGTYSSPYELLSGDFDGDGVDDIIVTDYNAVFPANSSLNILLGNGDGSFDEAVSFGSFSASLRIAEGDFDGDGNIDIVATEGSSGEIKIFLSNGNGTFANGATYATGGADGEIKTADFNGDGKLDIATIGGNNVRIFLANTDGSFNSGIDTSLPAGLYNHFAIADFDNDEVLDVIATATGGDAIVLLGDGNGSLQAQASFAPTTFVTDVRAEDFDRDGSVDIVLVDSIENTISTLRGQGDGTFAARTSIAISDPGRLEGGDFNGDGVFDLAVGDRSGGGVEVLYGSGTGSFSGPTSFSVGGGTITTLLVADIDHDGVEDLITAATSSANSIRVITGNSEEVTTAAHVDLLTQSTAQEALVTLDARLTRVSSELGILGAIQSRFASTHSTSQTSAELFRQAESRIVDVDVALEAAQLVRNQVLRDAAVAVLAQANQAPELALSLLSF